MHIIITKCYGLDVCAHPDSYVKLLTPNVMLLRGEPLGSN